MKTRSQRGIGLWFLAIPMLLLSQPVLLSAATATTELVKGESEKIVATVNGVPVYENTLAAATGFFLKKNKIIGMSGQTSQADARQRKKVLEALISAEVLRQASNGGTLAGIEEQVDRAIVEAKERHQSEEAFLKSLQMANKTFDEFKKELREQIILDDYLRRNKLKDFEIPQAQLEKFYKENQKSFTVAEQVKVRQILVPFDEKTGKQTENAYKLVSVVRERLEGSKDFDAVAKDVPSCSLVENCGVVDYFARGTMPVDFEKAAFSLKPGEVSLPVKTPYGYHIIELIDRRPETVRTFTEVREIIDRYLRRFLEEEKLTAHVVDLKKKADIKVFLP